SPWSRSVCRRRAGDAAPSMVSGSLLSVSGRLKAGARPSMLAQHEILSGERDYEQALDIVINTAERELLIFDQDFSRGAYAGVARYQALRDFLSRDSRNRLSIVLQDVGYFVSRCPRLYGLLSIYGHAMTVHETGEEAKAVRGCFVVADR